MASVRSETHQPGLLLNPLRLIQQRTELTPLIRKIHLQMDGLKAKYDTENNPYEISLAEVKMKDLIKRLEPLGLQLGKIDAVLLAEIAALILGFMVALAPFYKS